MTAAQLAFSNLDDCGRHAESMGGYLSTADFVLGPDRYLEHLRRIRRGHVPVIASLNGVSLGGWIEHASLIEQAGAHALELNMNTRVTDPGMSAAAVESRQLEVVRAVLDKVDIPVAVKLTQYYSSLPSFVRRLEEAGAAGVILFNRLYEADIDAEQLELDRTLRLSHEGELCRGCAGWPSCRRAPTSVWPPAAASTTAPARSRRSWPGRPSCRWCPRCCATAPSASPAWSPACATGWTSTATPRWTRPAAA
jgi:hypothetical protein